MRWFFLLLLLPHFTLSQSNFEKTYGPAPLAQGVEAITTLDGNYAVIINTLQPGTKDSFDLFLIKVNPAGSILWSRTYKTPGNIKAKSLHQSSDTSFFITGQSNSGGIGNYDYFLFKTSPAGDSLWTKFYGTVSGETFEASKPTADGGFILCGSSNGFGGWKYFIVKTNSTGDTLWTRVHGPTGIDFGESVALALDGGYLITGTITNSSPDIHLVKLSSTGAVQWTKTYNFGGAELTADAESTADSGFMILAASLQPLDSSVILMRTGKSGDTLFTRSFAGRSLGTDLLSHPGGYLLTGTTQRPGLRNQVFLINTGPAGTVAWQKYFGGSGNDNGSKVNAAAGGWVLAASTGSFGLPYDLAYLIRTDTAGSTDCPANAGFSASSDSTCAGKPVSLTNTTVTSYPSAWLADGTVFSSAPDATFYSDSAGTFEISLVVCSDTATSSIQVVHTITDIDVLITGSTVSFAVDTSVLLTAFSWNFGDGTADSANASPVHTYLLPGTYNVIFSFTDNNGCTDVIGKVVNIVLAGTGEATGGIVRVFPNPSRGFIVAKAASGDFQLQLMDAAGRILRTGTGVMECGGLPGGFYFLSARDGLHAGCVKVVVLPD